MTIWPTAFCSKCYAHKTYSVKEVMQKTKIRGISFVYPELRAYCDECGELIYSPPVADKNVYERHKAYYNKLEQMKGDSICERTV